MSKPAASPLSPTASGSGSDKLALGCAIPFGLVFSAIGFLAFWFTTLSPLLQQFASRSWVEAPCEILSSELVVNRDSDGATFRVAIRYRYTWQGESFESERYDFSTGSTNIGVDRMRAAVAAHPPGLHTVCFVDPADPASAVLSRDAPGLWWLGALTLLFPAFGLGFIFVAWRSTREKKRSAALGSALRAFGGGTTAPDLVTPGEATLKPAAGRVGTFVGLLFMTLFWNGIVSVFVVIAVRDFGQGFMGWFLPVFLIPFVAIGLLMIAGLLQAFSRLFAPPVELRLDPSLLRLGARVPFTWRLGGRGVRKLTLRLVGREEASYRQGTSTRTDRSDFHRAVLFESTDALALTEGRAEIALPELGSVPTLEAKNNKIVWELAVEGEIPWRADIEDNFTLAVRGPAAPAPATLTPEPLPHTGGGLTLWSLERFAPGETLVFTLARDPGAAAPNGPLSLQLGWFTEGRSSSDAEIVWREVLPSLPPGADRSFELRLPEAPWSFSGQLVALQWRLEVLDPKGQPLVAVPLVLAPAGEPPRLEALPEQSALKKWKAHFQLRR